MNIGKMDRRISMNEVTVVQDTFGEEIETLKELYETWAEVREMRGTERFTSQQTVGGAETKFRIRHRSDLNTKNRIVYEGTEYDITGILEIGKKQGLEIHAKSRAD